jgi:hypothetical protein
VLGVIAAYFDILDGVIPTLLALTILLNRFFYVSPEREERLSVARGDPRRRDFYLLPICLSGRNAEPIQHAAYGNVTSSPAKFNGIMPRFSSLSAASGENIIDAGGTSTDNASILLINWSPRTVFFSYPKGTAAGIQRIDLGINHHARPPDGSAGEFSAYEENSGNEYNRCCKPLQLEQPGQVGEVAQAIREALGWQAEIVYPPDTFKGTSYKTIDSSLFLKATGWRPSVPLVEGIRAVLDADYRGHTTKLLQP